MVATAMKYNENQLYRLYPLVYGLDFYAYPKI